MQCYSEESGRAGVTLRYVMLSYFFWFLILMLYHIFKLQDTGTRRVTLRCVALRYVTLLLCYVT